MHLSYEQRKVRGVEYDSEFVFLSGCRPSKRMPKYIELACKILLSLENGAILLVDF